MLPRLQFGLLILLMLSATALTAQEVAYLDLVDVKPRTELRAPPLPPPVCSENGTCIVSGNGFGSISCGAVTAGERRALKSTLISLDRFAYAAGDAAEMEIKIENVGSTEMALPWTPHLADLQPADEKQGFRYSSFAIILELASREDKTHKEIIDAAKLFGREDIPSSLVVVKPGESLRLRIKTKLAASSNKLKADNDYFASIIPELRSEIFVPNVKGGGYSTDIANEYPRRISGPELLLRIIHSQEGQAEVSDKLKESEAAIHFK